MRQIKRRRCNDDQDDKEKIETGVVSNISDMLSTDTAHHIFGFFVDKSGKIDGQSIRYAMLTCKKWKEVLYSKSIWSIPTGIDGEKPYHTGTVASSLHIRDVFGTTSTSSSSSSSSSSEVLSRNSLMAFTKLETLSASASTRLLNGYVSNVDTFVARERATERVCILTVSKDESKTPDLIKEISMGHYIQKGQFLMPKFNEDSDVDLSDPCYPSGIVTMNGRLIRWYQPRTNLRELIINGEQMIPSQLNDESQQSRSTNDNHALLTGGTTSQRQERLQHLLELEDSFGRINPERAHIRTNYWCALVDWILEIVECFDLEDVVAFDAMSLFDRFVASSSQQVNQQHFQLVAGACLLIASKRIYTEISSLDISFSADNTFNADQLAGMEDMIVQRLGWKLAYPTSLVFVLQYTSILQLEPTSRQALMMKYIVEMSLQSPIYLAYKPSMIAASAIVVAQFSIQAAEGEEEEEEDEDNTNDDPDRRRREQQQQEEKEKLWPISLQEKTKYTLDDLSDCIMELSRFLYEIRIQLPDLIIIGRRYRKAIRQRVAEIVIPFISSFESIQNYRTNTNNTNNNHTNHDNNDQQQQD